MKVLVTGGAGFIGSHLVEKLVARGDEVVVLDNLATGKLSNLSGVASRIEFVQMDIVHDGITEHFKKVDLVFHLAALADIVPSIEKPVDYMNVNVLGTVRVLEAARVNDVSRVIYIASSSCYGIPNSYPTKEDEAINPKYPYALSKYLGEEVFFHWLDLYKLTGLSLRLFNVYGPRARSSGGYGAVMGVFIGQKLSGMPLTVVGDGNQERDFTYIDDVTHALVAAGLSRETGFALNIGASSPVSVNKIAQIIGGEVIHIPKRPGEPDRTHADIQKAIEVLNWHPDVNISKGLEITLQDAKSWVDAPAWTVAEIEKATATWFKFLKNKEE